MKRQAVRRSTVGIINPVFQNKKGNSFFRANAERAMPATDKEGLFIQKQSDDHEMEDSMQMVPEEENEEQLMSQPEEEGQIQAEEEEQVQMKEEEEQVQAKEEEDEVQTKEEEEEEVQAKEEEQIQMKEEEEQIQAKTAGAGGRQKQAELMEPLLHRRKGAGNPLEGKSRELMEQGFGADFSQIRIHTDAESHIMNQSIHAQA
ncbi:DUF4157 domain-containing protein, partial [Cyclobacterium sp.]|uniref:eCIS core domain-containing protein n=1 Tax=Cyclobacterium sp. TaxID=1966343 RepID=UPI0019B7C5CA